MRGWLAVVAIGIVACESFGASDEDNGSKPPGGDAGADGSTDGGVSADGSAAPDGADAARGCSVAGSIFCEGFDAVSAGTAPAIPGWKSFLEAGNSYSVVPEGRTTPNALVVEGNGVGFALMSASVLDPGPADFVLETSINVGDGNPPFVQVQVSWFREQDTKRRAVAVTLTPNNSFVTEYDGVAMMEEKEPAKPLAFGPWAPGWHDVSLEMSGGAALVTVRVDKTLLGTVQLVRPHLGGRLTLELGAYGFDFPTTKRVLYDDVVVRTK